MSSPLAEIFGKSPIKPLQHHMKIAQTAAQLVLKIFDSVSTGYWSDAELTKETFCRHKEEADTIKKNLRLHLKDCFLPAARTDLLALLETQDCILNQAKDLAGLLLGRKIQLPHMLRNDYRVFLSHCIDAIDIAAKAVNELDELLETSFSGDEAALVERMIVEVDITENYTDRLKNRLQQQLFAVKQTLPPIEVIFLYQLFQQTSVLADRAQTAGEDLRLLLASK